ncbi:hypothetical protein Vadar_005325 [Vaccinium darrowii]|uniref:Uncharacterized protein n=1 Tax=Vaccinium darrowii TaxID=229202 RepID=A0ACB7X886_9ERIC|nr:hypothetical protein Vadar_005325 [Vaccinium darrowii]
MLDCKILTSSKAKAPTPGNLDHRFFGDEDDGLKHCFLAFLVTRKFIRKNQFKRKTSKTINQLRTYRRGTEKQKVVSHFETLLGSDAEKTYDDNIDGGLTVFCLDDDSFKNFLPNVDPASGGGR